MSSSLPLKPLGVRAASGLPIPAPQPQTILAAAEDLPGAEERSKAQQVLGVAYTVRDPMDLTGAGWGVLFASDADPRIEQELQPLLDLRRRQVQNPKLFQVFSGPALGVKPGMSANSWAFSRGVSLTAPVDPRKGVPYYLLLVGSPQAISFEFQALLKMQWAVGRIYFDDVEDYGRYARAVVAYEDAQKKPTQARNAAVWITSNPGDDATLLLSSAMRSDFEDDDNALGNDAGFHVDSFTAEEATKSQLESILRGEIDGGAPALVFTGSHGMEYPLEDANLQSHQGALLTQEWEPGLPVTADNQFAASDVPDSETLAGAIFFLFACYSGGCPIFDSYNFGEGGAPRKVAPAPLIARLPQALLAGGALAVIAHVDMAYTYGFATDEDTPQPQVIRTPLELLMRGKRAGLAMDALTTVWSALSAQIGEGTARSLGTTAPAPDIARRANLLVARDDARNYILLGDPAVRLRVEDLV